MGVNDAVDYCLQVRYLFSEDISNGKEAIPVSNRLKNLNAPDAYRHDLRCAHDNYTRLTTKLVLPEFL